MTMVVHKYQLDLTPVQTLHLPAGARFLHLADQNGRPTLWALVDSSLPALTPHRFEIYGTGQTLAEPHQTLEHVATVCMRDGHVWHLFQRFTI